MHTPPRPGLRPLQALSEAISSPRAPRAAVGWLVALLLLAPGMAAATAGADSGKQESATQAAQRIERRAQRLSHKLMSWLDLARNLGAERTRGCLDEQLSQVHSTLRNVARRRLRLQRALLRGSPSAVELEAQALHHLDSRLARLDRSAQLCKSGQAGPDHTTVEMRVLPPHSQGEPAALP